MNISIPSQDTKQFSQPNKGEIFGNLWITKNIDLMANRGKIRLSERLKLIYDTSDDADMECPIAFVRSDADQTDRWWALVNNDAQSTTDGLLFKTSGTSPLTGWAQDAIGSTPTAAVDDMVVFGRINSYDRLVVATSTTLSMLNNGVWTASWWVTTLGQTALQSGEPHPLYTFKTSVGGLSRSILIIGDGNYVHTVSEDIDVDTEDLIVHYRKLTLPENLRVIWIRSTSGTVYIGTQDKLGHEAFVIVWDGVSDEWQGKIPVNDDISLAGVNWNNSIYTINGKGQLLGGEGLAQVATLPVFYEKKRWDDSLTRPQLVHRNGMNVIDDKIHIFINGIIENTATDVLENMPSGVWEFDPKVGLYCKYTVGQYRSTNNDWGAPVIARNGAIKETSMDFGHFLLGADVFSDNASTKVKGIIVSDVEATATQRGHFVTSQIPSSAVRNFWQRVWAKFKQLENSTDRIVVKYRTDKDKNFPAKATIAWTDTDTFTSTDADFANAVVGDEIEILTGKGAGATAHILATAFASPTYTIDLDEAIPNASGSAQVRIQNWTKLGTISSQTIQRQLFRIAKRSNWIQFKIELRGTETSPELEELLLEFKASNI